MAKRRRGRRALAVACLAFQAAAATLAWATDSTPAAMAADPVLVGAGGIASCDTAGDEATAALINALPGATVFTAGDNAYEKGTAAQFAQCYGKTWGKFKARTRPAPGNHDYATNSGGPYYDYFGAAAGTKGQGWYSYNLGAWHIVVLNSNCSGKSSCAKGSAQERWLKADLAASNARCTAAVIHHPRFSSDNVEGNKPQVAPLWDALYAAGADLVISGHARVYERFAPQTPAGKANSQYGIPLINVGTGGRGHAGFKAPVANSVVRNATTWGVLKLTLHADSYDFAFLPVAGAKFKDSGSGTCHGAPPTGSPSPPGGGEDGGGGGSPAATRLTFRPDADATVAKGAPNANYAAKPTLLADGSPLHAAFLRFTVSGVEATVTRARLRLWVTDGSVNGPAVYPTGLGLGTATGPPWPEWSITWNKRPVRTGPALADLGAVKAGRYVDFDVTSQVTGNGAYSFELATGNADGTHFASGEATTTSRRPQLIVDVAPPPPV